MSNRKVIRTSDVMKKQFVELDGLLTVKDAIQAMKDKDITAVLIKKRHENDEFGIVQLSDIAKKVLAKDKNPDRTNLYEIMSKPILSVPPTMDVRYCSRLFDQFGLSSAPVIDHGTVVGMVSYNELVLHGLVELID